MLKNPLASLEKPTSPQEALFYGVIQSFTEQSLLPSLDEAFKRESEKQQHLQEEFADKVNLRLDNQAQVNEVLIKSMDTHLREAERALHDATRDAHQQSVENRMSSQKLQDVAIDFQKTIGLIAASDRNQDEQIAELKIEAARLNAEITGLISRLTVTERSLTLTQEHQVLLRDEIRGTFSGMKDELFQRLDTMQKNIDALSKPKGNRFTRWFSNNALFVLYTVILVLAAKAV